MVKDSRDLYSVLGLTKSASTAEIKKAYKRLARKFHPDVNPGNKGAEAKFKEISHAADVLSDPEKRKLYDRYGEVAFSSGFDAGRAARAEEQASRGFGGGQDPGGVPRDFEFFSDLRRGTGFRGIEDLFESLGGGGARARAPQGGESVEVEARISFAEAVRGTTLTVPVRTRRPCSACNGSGHVDNLVCQACRGSGERVETERVKVRVPEGVDEGSKVRVAGKGSPGGHGGSPGHLFVTVRVNPHPYFERKGDDIYSEVPVTVREAYAGSEIEIPTVHGPVRAKIPPGTVGGQKFRLRGRGVRNPQTRAHGDHVYRINILIPSVLTDAGRAAADRLEVLYGGPVRSHLPRSLEEAEPEPDR